MLCSLLNELQLHMRTLDNARIFCTWSNFTPQKTELSTLLNKVAKRSRNFTQHACRALYSEKSRAFGQGLKQNHRNKGLSRIKTFPWLCFRCFTVTIMWNLMSGCFLTRFLNNFLSNTKARKCEELVKNMHYLVSNFDWFPDTLRSMSDNEQKERLHNDMKYSKWGIKDVEVQSHWLLISRCEGEVSLQLFIAGGSGG